MATESRKEIIGGLTYLFTTTRGDDGWCKVVVTHGTRIVVSMGECRRRQVAEATSLARRLTVCDAGDIAAMFAERDAARSYEA